MTNGRKRQRRRELPSESFTIKELSRSTGRPSKDSAAKQADDHPKQPLNVVRPKEAKVARVVQVLLHVEQQSASPAEPVPKLLAIGVSSPADAF